MQGKFEGCVLGLAIGDALSWPTEFLKLRAIKSKWGKKGITSLVGKPAPYMDGTQMTLCIARALIEAGSKDLVIPAGGPQGPSPSRMQRR